MILSNQVSDKTFSQISGMLVLSIIGMVFTIVIISAYLLYTENYSWDTPNWIALIVELGIGIGITGSVLIYSNHQTKKSQLQQEKISELINEIKKMEEKQHDFLEKEKSEKNKRKIHAYYAFGREFSNIKRYLKDLEAVLNNNPESDEDLNHHKDLAQRYVEATNNSISIIRRIADIFRLDIEFDFQMRVLMYVTKLETDMSFIRQGSNGFLPRSDGLIDELTEIITILDESLNKRKN